MTKASNCSQAVITALDKLHKGDDLFIAVNRAADHGALHDVAMRTQHCLHFGRIHVEAGADDHLLGTADDIEAFAVKTREIAGVEPALTVNHLGGQIRRAIIAAHDVAAAYMQLADFARRDRNAVERPATAPSTPRQRPVPTV